MEKSRAYIAMQQVLAAYRERYMEGLIAWIAAGDVDLDARSRYRGPRRLQWHPPLALPDAHEYEEARLDAWRQLATMANHPRLSLIGRSKDIAWLMWIHEQIDWFYAKARSSERRFGPGPPCLYCGLLTHQTCDGVPPSVSVPGWVCEFPVCTTCWKIFHECPNCAKYVGIPGKLADKLELPAVPAHHRPSQVIRRALNFERIPPAEWPNFMHELFSNTAELGMFAEELL